jgi:MSHA pilin protein MshD
MLKHSRGVTLIELIIGIVVLAISLTIITAVLGPLYIKSADPWHQVRAAELGQSFINEILGRSYDQHSSRSGSLLRCNETGASDCTAEANFGPDGSENRLSFNDVDDFHNFTATGEVFSNILDLQPELSDYYRGYKLNVAIAYAGAQFGLNNQQVKRITVSVTTPTGEQIDFAAYKGNW